MGAVFNIHIQVLVDVGFHTAVELSKEFVDHTVPISFFFINVSISINGQLTPGFN